MNKGEVLIYQTANGETSLDVKLEQETIWINRQQMAELFDRDIKTIGKHINNALKEELKGFSTVAKFATVQHEGERIVTRNVEYYNIEMITSVGYRVKSQQGTQFRIWANRVLKEVLMKGYTVKDNIKLEQYEELKQTIKVLANVLDHKTLEYTEATGLLRVVTDYTYALDTLDKYDYQKLEIDETTHKEQFRATYENATTAINKLREKFGGSSLFGNEKDQSFKGSIGAVYQTFGSQDLYPSIEEKAAILLYLVTKNHSFSDGNKRIAAFLFLWFMERNGILYKTIRMPPPLASSCVTGSPDCLVGSQKKEVILS